MKARQHRGSFQESMLTLRDIESTLEAVYEYFNDEFMQCYFPFDISQIVIMEYGGIDSRHGWEAETWLVTVKGFGIVGMISHLVKTKNS